MMRALLSLAPESQFFGAGGPLMRAVAGDHLMDWTQEAVVGLWDVMVKYPYFRKQFYRMYREILELQPSAVIFVDYPGFNLRLAEYLRRQRFSGKLIYYISPQVWAWNRHRIRRMARFLDLMLVIFPFEKQLYEQSGLRTVFVGHPIVEEQTRSDQPRDKRLIGLLPGSRSREVRRILPVMLEAGRLIQARDPSMRFIVGAATSSVEEVIRKMVVHSALKNVTVRVRGAKDLMQEAFAGMVASGTATLESSFYRFPFVLVYKVSWLTYIPGRLLIRVKYLGMPNILAGKEIIPEFIQHRADPAKIADALWRLCSDENARKQMICEMDRIIVLLGEEGAGFRAACAVIQGLS
ncbi:MAG: lipid-A-disaccharide synthase [Verrucomicrobia bacterium]|nr:lipid-A-disaccharide synthase [Verrucomicrobiota bacterium]MBV9673592.1 lipid-A-disaccharide synthase [Verrucomicrobiota bacterium]